MEIARDYYKNKNAARVLDLMNIEPTLDTWIRKFKLDHDKLLCGTASLSILAFTLFIVQYTLHISSIFVVLLTIIASSTILWKVLRTFYDFIKCKKEIQLIIKTSFLMVFLFLAGYLVSENILRFLDPHINCNKAIKCTIESCPMSFDISDACYFTQQFLAANIQFSGIEIVYLFLAYFIGEKILK